MVLQQLPAFLAKRICTVVGLLYLLDEEKNKNSDTLAQLLDALEFLADFISTDRESAGHCKAERSGRMREVTP